MSYELSCGQVRGWHTQTHTHTQTHRPTDAGDDNARKPKLASGKNQYVSGWSIAAHCILDSTDVCLWKNKLLRCLSATETSYISCQFLFWYMYVMRSAGGAIIRVRCPVVKFIQCIWRSGTRRRRVRDIQDQWESTENNKLLITNCIYFTNMLSSAVKQT